MSNTAEQLGLTEISDLIEAYPHLKGLGPVLREAVRTICKIPADFLDLYARIQGLKWVCVEDMEVEKLRERETELVDFVNHLIDSHQILKRLAKSWDLPPKFYFPGRFPIPMTNERIAELNDYASLVAADTLNLEQRKTSSEITDEEKRKIMIQDLVKIFPLDKPNTDSLVMDIVCYLTETTDPDHSFYKIANTERTKRLENLAPDQQSTNAAPLDIQFKLSSKSPE